jgi:hypothetical protein
MRYGSLLYTMFIVLNLHNYVRPYLFLAYESCHLFTRNIRENVFMLKSICVPIQYSYTISIRASDFLYRLDSAFYMRSVYGKSLSLIINV